MADTLRNQGLVQQMPQRLCRIFWRECVTAMVTYWEVNSNTVKTVGIAIFLWYSTCQH